jgi:hypothetical protein
MTGIAAARAGRSAVVVCRYDHAGSLPANGLGATAGLFEEFVGRIEATYIGRYGPDSEQVADCDGGCSTPIRRTWRRRTAGPVQSGC